VLADLGEKFKFFKDDWQQLQVFVMLQHQPNHRFHHQLGLATAVVTYILLDSFLFLTRVVLNQLSHRYAMLFLNEELTSHATIQFNIFFMIELAGSMEPFEENLSLLASDSL
jgi:hypothetical protein